MTYLEMDREALEAEKAAVEAQYEEYKAAGYNLDMSRGKPAPEQLDLSRPMLDIIGSDFDFENAAEMDVRNYGGLTGIKEARLLMGSIMRMPSDNVIVMGNSSLTIMYELIAHAMTHGIMGSEPWDDLPEIKFICPAPGYDRHFAICEHFGIQMELVPMTQFGPDMDLVDELVKDPAVKGMWCVPQYSNPLGLSYSDDTMNRISTLSPAAPDFRLFWDNAYAIHHLNKAPRMVRNIKNLCERAGNPDMYYEFASTSKVTFPGAGIAAVAASDANIADIKGFIKYSMIGPDKINQLRHVLFFKEPGSLEAHMQKQAELIAPKFEAVLEALQRNLGDTGAAWWTEPKGGYFITFFGLKGTAERTVALAAEAGVKLTPAGAMYPYGYDPEDSAIRIAPTYPSLDDLKLAAELFCCCAKLAALEAILAA